MNEATRPRHAVAQGFVTGYSGATASDSHGLPSAVPESRCLVWQRSSTDLTRPYRPCRTPQGRSRFFVAAFVRKRIFSLPAGDRHARRMPLRREEGVRDVAAFACPLAAGQKAYLGPEAPHSHEWGYGRLSGDGPPLPHPDPRRYTRSRNGGRGRPPSNPSRGLRGVSSLGSGHPTPPISSNAAGSMCALTVRRSSPSRRAVST